MTNLEVRSYHQNKRKKLRLGAEKKMNRINFMGINEEGGSWPISQSEPETLGLLSLTCVFPDFFNTSLIYAAMVPESFFFFFFALGLRSILIKE